MKDWRDQYESAADAEFAGYSARSVDELLADIRRGRFGEYDQLWRAVAERGTAAKVAWPLLDVLMSDRPYLERYHCASALLQVLRCQDFEAVELSAAWPSRSENLVKLRRLVEQAAGARPT